MTGELSWLATLKRTYIGNATATRDMRVQLRGSRAVVLFTIYLFVMTLVLLWVYYDSLGGGNSNDYSLAMAQSRLQGFYYATLGSLAVVVTLVAPSMGAFAIVSEKMRRSLDLVFSAPTEPKYYLVGKLISSYRYVWLLLVLSLPFCAVSVTLGGTTWSQLFITFVMYSMYGLVCVSFGLLMSTLCNKVLPAIIWTYAAIGCYLFLTGGLLAVGAVGSRGSFTNINPVFSLNPVCYSFLADQTWQIFGRDIPTWILSVLMHLLVVKFVVLAAGSMLAPGRSKEISGLRLHALFYSAAVIYLFAISISPLFQSTFGYLSRTPGEMKPIDGLQVYHGRALFGLLFALGIMVVPYLSSFGFNDLRRHRPDGIFKVRETFTGRPSGHLPFLLLLFAVSVAAYIFGSNTSLSSSTFTPFGTTATSPVPLVFHPLSVFFCTYTFLILAIWLTAFFLGWYSSSRRPILSRGRTISLFFFVLGLILPTALFSIIAPEDARTATGIWLINPIAGVISDTIAWKIAVVHGVILTCIAVFLFAITISKVAKQASQNFDSRSGDRNDSIQQVPAV